MKLAGAAAAAGIAVDSTVLSPNLPGVVRKELFLRRWSPRLDNFSIALLSDFHYDADFSVHPLAASIAIVNSLKPDLIALTGDFVSLPLLSSRYAKAAVSAIPCAQLLRRMYAPSGLWAVLGNHDHYSDPVRITGILQDAGVEVLSNRSVAIEKDGARFWLAGVDDVLGGVADLSAALQQIPAGESTVLMAHEPDYADYVTRYPVDLQLSGHSHGGQIRVPLVHPFYLPPLGEKYVSGLYKIGRLTLYTNPGLGTVGIPVRLNCPPEITLITLRSAG